MTTDLNQYDPTKLPGADVLKHQRYAIIVADWNSEITFALAEGARQTLLITSNNFFAFKFVLISTRDKSKFLEDTEWSLIVQTIDIENTSLFDEVMREVGLIDINRDSKWGVS